MFVTNEFALNLFIANSSSAIVAMNNSNPFVWTCGNNDKISHRRPISSGGSGEVHEVSPLSNSKLKHANKDGFKFYSRGMFALVKDLNAF
jgi:hypothetical protein